jgi:hypothetical protein
MTAANRIADYSDTFDSYTDNTQLTDVPVWTTFGASNLWVSNAASVAVVYALEGADATAVHENTYPLNQYAAFSVGDAGGGAGTYNGIGINLRLGGSGGFYWYYYVYINTTTDTLAIIKIDTSIGPTPIELHSGSIGAAPVIGGSVFYCEVETTTTADRCQVRVYDTSDTLIASAYDDNELTSGAMGAVVSRAVGFTPSIFAVEFGHIDTDALRSFDTVNPDGIIKSQGPIILTGNGLSEINKATISEAGGVNPYVVAITAQTAQTITLAPIDVQYTPLTYGTLTMTLEHPTDPANMTHAFNLAPADGWQAVTLSGATDNQLLLTDTDATNGDTMEIPSSDGFSTFTLSADGDVLIDAAANQGMVFLRRLYDETDSTWYSGNVTINQIPDDGGELLRPSWRSTPAPPNAVVGTWYQYNIGYLITGSRPMQLAAAPGSTPLPNGLSYNNSSYPETIEGTITSGSGTITVNNIITRATNGV